MFSIVFKKSAIKELEQLPHQAAKRISKVIDELSENPRPAGSKKLQGQKEVLWRVRSGDYRVVYFIEDVIHIVEIRRIGHRKNIYE
jgi:mRNA interferase RelE/StbE